MSVSFEHLRNVCKNSPCSSQGHFPTNLSLSQHLLPVLRSRGQPRQPLLDREFPQVRRHRQGTLSPIYHRVKHHAFHFTFDAIHRCAHMLETLCCLLHCFLVVFMQEVFLRSLMPLRLRANHHIVQSHLPTRAPPSCT